MVLVGYIPFFNLVIMITICVLARRGILPGWTWVLAPAWLLLIPPIVVRATLSLRPLPREDIAVGSSAFLIWWFTSQWQTIFNRLPWIEEMIRLIPGLYAMWLRLWGAKVGRLVYWTPGLRILDRSLVSIGDHATFGAGVKIHPHIIMPNDKGELVLRVATVSIGRGSMVGGSSVLLAGSWVGDGEISMAKRDLRPFTGWKNGRRIAPGQTTSDSHNNP